ncbi:MAG: acetate/propionate family kinase [Actinomycetota bacterium]|nr:acetate/propionate family kinase [Actinomycetota bacterium]MDQ6945123.1 acetate/propionate family kinase [Actinomycetota bacterium]
MKVLTVNAGSSSLKLRIIGPGDGVGETADLPRHSGESVAAALSNFLAEAPAFDAVGHRVVHGGAEFDAPVLLDQRAEAALDRLDGLAPLHNPPAVEAVRVLLRLRPGLPQVACFDTAFHAGLPSEASTYALPHEWITRWGLRRYGFHGLSHRYASRRGAQLVGRPASELRLVTAHLGSGASLAAVAAGRSVDTTMGFTPLAGLVMATRSGDVDPGLVLWLLQETGLTVQQVEDGLENGSGLLGLSGVSADLRAVLTAVDAGDDRAGVAYAVYLHRLRAAVAAMAASMGGLDGVVFTGGIGENSARLRRDACRGLNFLGVAVDDDANEQLSGDRVVSPAGTSVFVVVVAAREDLEIARQVRKVLAAGYPNPDPST